MANDRLCRGDGCPNRKQCRWFREYLAAIAAGNTRPQTASHCSDGKRFERYALDHPQMQHGKNGEPK